MIRRPPRSTQSRSSAASDVYKRQVHRRQRYARAEPQVGQKIIHVCARRYLEPGPKLERQVQAVREQHGAERREHCGPQDRLPPLDVFSSRRARHHRAKRCDYETKRTDRCCEHKDRSGNEKHATKLVRLDIRSLHDQAADRHDDGEQSERERSLCSPSSWRSAA